MKPAPARTTRYPGADYDLGRNFGLKPLSRNSGFDTGHLRGGHCGISAKRSRKQSFLAEHAP